MRCHRTIPLLLLAFAVPAHARAQTPRPTTITQSATDLVYAAFRDADSIRRIERPIDDDARAAVQELLPFRVYFAELSTHVLHVAFRGKKPLGLFYVRPEETEWGLAEIGWAIALDGHIVSFTVVNARNARAEALPTTPFGQALIGQQLADLKRAEAAPAGETRPDPLEVIVRRSALKATAVVTVVWADELSKLADLAMLYDEFPGAERFRRLLVPTLPGDAAITRGTLHVMEAQAQGHYDLGSAIASVCRLGGADVQIRWVLDSEGRIVRATPVASWATGDVRTLCGALSGRRLGDAPLTDNPLSAAANEIAAAIAAQREAKRGRAR